MASGVRNSCEASAVKRACRSKAASRRSKVSLRTRARSASSRSTPAASMRSDRFVAEMADAVAEMAATGRRMRDDTSQPPARPTARTTAPAAVSCQAKRSSSAKSAPTGAHTATRVRPGPSIVASRYSPRWASPTRAAKASAGGSEGAGSSGGTDVFSTLPSARHTANDTPFASAGTSRSVRRRSRLGRGGGFPGPRSGGGEPSRSNSGKRRRLASR